ncbi:MAG: ankyrin repeat domain-containing protein [Rhodobacteraceae bacterium]|nr:ankyrin repeat domain-containing protein [Paracoccaceae bacterium]
MAKSFDAEGLKQFLFREDRMINPFFTGRKDLQYRIDQKSKIIGQDYLKDPDSNPAAGQTQVIQGPPGIGKTSLLEKIRQNCIDQLNDESVDHKTIPVMIADPANLTFNYLGTRIQETISGLDNKITIAGVKEKARMALRKISSVSAFGAGVGWDNSSEGKLVFPRNYTILLLVDEIQSIPPDKQSDQAKVIHRLHTGSNRYPVFPVFAGLSNSKTVLMEAVSPRLGVGAVHHLQPLSQEEVKESLGKFLHHFKVKSTPGLTSDWGDRIGEWVDGWPKHVENSLRALGESLLEVEGKLSTVDDLVVKDRATQFRVDYYNSRFGKLESTKKIIGEIMAEMGSKPISGLEIMQIIGRTIEKPQWTEKTIKPKIEGLDFDFLHRYGFIDIIPNLPDTLFQCPIPSLHSYAVATTGSPLHTLAYSNDIESFRKMLDLGHDINGKDAWGRTPLTIASENNWHKLAFCMVKEGAMRDPSPIDDTKGNNPTANHLAKDHVSDKSPSGSGGDDNDFNPSPDFDM